MANKTIPQYIDAGGIDPSSDKLLLWQNSTNTYRSINRNTLLGSSGTPVDTSSTQTLQNKVIDNTNTVTLLDTKFTLQDNADSTKQAKFELSGISTATTRTYTLPNASATLADISTVQTFTNKTLTSPTINGGTIANPTLTIDSINEFTSGNGVTVAGLNLKNGKLNTNNSVITSNITDDAITAAKIDWASTGANAGIWWEELGRTTLGVNGDTISVTGIAARKYIRILVKVLNSGTITCVINFNGDTGTNYAIRNSANGAADATAVSTNIPTLTNGASPQFITIDIENTTAQEKYGIYSANEGSAAGAATAPNRRLGIFKWANTAAQITRVDILNTQTGDFVAGSQVVVIGHD